MQKRLLKAADVAELLATSENAVRLLVFRRQIPYLKLNRRVLFDESEIVRWLDSQRRVTPDEALEAVGR